jgi:hypothetical protein
LKLQMDYSVRTGIGEASSTGADAQRIPPPPKGNTFYLPPEKVAAAMAKRKMANGRGGAPASPMISPMITPEGMINKRKPPALTAAGPPAAAAGPAAAVTRRPALRACGRKRLEAAQPDAEATRLQELRLAAEAEAEGAPL